VSSSIDGRTRGFYGDVIAPRTLTEADFAGYRKNVLRLPKEFGVSPRRNKQELNLFQ